MKGAGKGSLFQSDFIRMRIVNKLPATGYCNSLYFYSFILLYLFAFRDCFFGRNLGYIGPKVFLEHLTKLSKLLI